MTAIAEETKDGARERERKKRRGGEGIRIVEGLGGFAAFRARLAEEEEVQS